MAKRRYTVKSGDSWFRIAGKVYAGAFGGDVVAAQRMAGELARANNGIFNLKPGMVLKLPSPPKKGQTPYISPGQAEAFGIGEQKALPVDQQPAVTVGREEERAPEVKEADTVDATPTPDPYGAATPGQSPYAGIPEFGPTPGQSLYPGAPTSATAVTEAASTAQGAAPVGNVWSDPYGMTAPGQDPYAAAPAGAYAWDLSKEVTPVTTPGAAPAVQAPAPVAPGTPTPDPYGMAIPGQSPYAGAEGEPSGYFPQFKYGPPAGQPEPEWKQDQLYEYKKWFLGREYYPLTFNSYEVGRLVEIGITPAILIAMGYRYDEENGVYVRYGIGSEGELSPEAQKELGYYSPPTGGGGRGGGGGRRPSPSYRPMTQPRRSYYRPATSESGRAYDPTGLGLITWRI